MAYNAKVLPIMIASPGDVLDARRLVRDLIHEWNYVHSLPNNIVLMPVAWETHTSPELSARPQELINERVLKDCDLLIGLFWTRLGTPTGKAASGSVEEIERHLAAGKPVMAYFSSEPVAPASLDPHQYTALLEFKRWCQSRGLIEEFENLPDLAKKFTRHLQITLRDNRYLHELVSSAKNGEEASFQASLSAPGASLSDEAKEMLVEAAADKSGDVLKMRHLGGIAISTNGKTFGSGGDPRAEARWVFALDQLVSDGLLTPQGAKSPIFKVSKAGYDLADRLKRPG